MRRSNDRALLTVGEKAAAALLVKNESDAVNPMRIGVRADWAVAWQSGGGYLRKMQTMRRELIIPAQASCISAMS